MGEAVAFTLQKLAEFDYQWLDKPPVWIVCKSCHTRNILYRDHDKYRADCLFCERTETVLVEDFLCNPIEVISERAAPKVLLDTLLDYIGLGVRGGTNYIGGLEHLERTLTTLQRIFSWQPQEICWRCRPWMATSTDFELARHIMSCTNASTERAVRMLATGRIGMLSLLPDTTLLPRLRLAIELEATTTLHERRIVDIRIDNASPWMNNRALENLYRALH